MAGWLSFWNAEIRAGNKPRQGTPLESAWIPWAAGKIDVGDDVYAVGIDDGELLLISRVVVDSVRVTDAATEKITIESRESEAMRFDRIVPRRTVDQLRYLDAAGEEQRFARAANGRLQGTPFQGRASLRELAPRSGELLADILARTPPEVADLEERVAQGAGSTARSGRLMSKAERDAVEERALDVAKDHYSKRGWTLLGDYRRRPYDLHFEKKGRQLFVEVKGTQADGALVGVTSGEVNFARKNKPNSALFVVSGIELARRGKKSVARGGSGRVVAPWNPHEKDLAAVAYVYTVR